VHGCALEKEDEEKGEGERKEEEGVDTAVTICN